MADFDGVEERYRSTKAWIDGGELKDYLKTLNDIHSKQVEILQDSAEFSKQYADDLSVAAKDLLSTVDGFSKSFRSLLGEVREFSSLSVDLSHIEETWKSYVGEIPASIAVLGRLSPGDTLEKVSGLMIDLFESVNRLTQLNNMMNGDVVEAVASSVVDPFIMLANDQMRYLRKDIQDLEELSYVLNLDPEQVKEFQKGVNELNQMRDNLINGDPDKVDLDGYVKLITKVYSTHSNMREMFKDELDFLRRRAGGRQKEKEFLQVLAEDWGKYAGVVPFVKGDPVAVRQAISKYLPTVFTTFSSAVTNMADMLKDKRVTGKTAISMTAKVVAEVVTLVVRAITGLDERTKAMNASLARQFGAKGLGNRKLSEISQVATDRSGNDKIFLRPEDFLEAVNNIGQMGVSLRRMDQGGGTFADLAEAERELSLSVGSSIGNASELIGTLVGEYAIGNQNVSGITKGLSATIAASKMDMKSFFNTYMHAVQAMSPFANRVRELNGFLLEVGNTAKLTGPQVQIWMDELTGYAKNVSQESKFKQLELATHYSQGIVLRIFRDQIQFLRNQAGKSVGGERDKFLYDADQIEVALQEYQQSGRIADLAGGYAYLGLVGQLNVQIQALNGLYGHAVTAEALENISDGQQLSLISTVLGIGGSQAEQERHIKGLAAYLRTGHVSPEYFTKLVDRMSKDNAEKLHGSLVGLRQLSTTLEEQIAAGIGGYFLKIYQRFDWIGGFVNQIIQKGFSLGAASSTSSGGASSDGLSFTGAAADVKRAAAAGIFGAEGGGYFVNRDPGAGGWNFGRPQFSSWVNRGPWETLLRKGVITPEEFRVFTTKGLTPTQSMVNRVNASLQQNKQVVDDIERGHIDGLYQAAMGWIKQRNLKIQDDRVVGQVMDIINQWGLGGLQKRSGMFDAGSSVSSADFLKWRLFHKPVSSWSSAQAQAEANRRWKHIEDAFKHFLKNQPTEKPTKPPVQQPRGVDKPMEISYQLDVKVRGNVSGSDVERAKVFFEGFSG